MEWAETSGCDALHRKHCYD